MNKVVMLNPRERISRDLARLLAADERQTQEYPPISSAMDVALEDLSQMLGQVAVAYGDGRLKDVSIAARDAADRARELGLNRAFRVGQTVAALATKNDSVALAANVARLMRLGDAALTSMWEYRDTHC